MEVPRVDGPWLLSHEPIPPLVRACLGLFGLVPLWAIWDLVVRPWPAVLTWAGILIVPIVLGALSVGGIFLAAAILGPEQDVLVDPLEAQVVVVTRLRWLGPHRRFTAFGDIEEVAIRKDYDPDGPDRLKLVLVVRDRKLPLTLLSRPMDRRAELEELAARLRAALQP